MTDSLTYTLSFRATVVSVEEKFTTIHTLGIGDQAEFEKKSKGWYIGLERSHELLYAGPTRPPTNPGDEAIIRINFYAASIPASSG